MTIIIFIIVLAILIFVHELGHFLLARWNGVRVDEFKIGFGPRIFYWKRGETEYGVNIIPFGGFVKIHGENPDEDSMNGPDAGRSLVNKNRWRQASVLAAGVVFNFIFAWILYVAVFTSGVTATTDGFEKYADSFENPRVMLTYVSPGSPAEVAGLKAGDVLDKVGDMEITVVDDNSSESIKGIQGIIDSSKGSEVVVHYSRDGYAKVATTTPVVGLVESKYAIGISMQSVGDLKLSLPLSILEGLRYTGMMIKETAIGLYTFVANIFSGSANLSDVAGPVGIAGIVGNAAAMGFVYLMMVTALISVNLGVINLLPLPALDGGRILFVAMEGIIRRRISPRFQNAVNSVGFTLLIILMVVITYSDVAKLFR